MKKEEEGQKAKIITIPRYADKYKDMLQQSSKKQRVETILQVSPKQQLENQPKMHFFYRIRSIGVGAHSFVYLVQEEETKMLLAEKSITISHAREVAEDLGRQIKILAFVEHENLIKLYHFHRTESHISLVMEYAQDSLFNLKQRFQVFKEKEVLEVARQLLNGLHYLHTLGIVHADIKLQNIMIANGTIKLCDFGYAHRHPEQRTKQQVVGTMEYLPPEYARGVDSGSKRDIWAVGILAFEMFLGKTPFEGLKENQKWSKLIKASPDEYIKEFLSAEQQMGKDSPRIEELLKHIFVHHEERWNAQRLLKLAALQPLGQ